MGVQRGRGQNAVIVAMQLPKLVCVIADILKEFDSEHPVHGAFKPGIGPFGEPQLIKQVAQRLTRRGISARTRRSPDMAIGVTWAIEFKVVRPFRDDDKEAESWSQNLLHPYRGNISLIGDALKHDPPRVDLDPLFASFELISRCQMGIPLGQRVEERRGGLVHPTHQVVRCLAWQLDGEDKEA